MNLDLALKKYERLATFNPRDGTAHLALALLYDTKGDPIQAAKSFQLAVECAPREAAIRFFDGSFLARYAGKMELAVQQWERAFDLNPEIFSNLSRGIPEDVDYPLEEKMRETVEAFSKEAGQSSGNAHLLACHALAAGLCLGAEEGLAAFGRIQETILLHPRSLYLYGLFLDVADRSDQAVKILERALDLDRNATAVWYLLGRCQMKLEKLPHALKAFERVKDLDPRHEKGLWSLGEIYFKQGRFELTVQTLNQLLKLNSRHARAHYLIGRAQQEVYNLEAAVSAYREALRHDSGLHEAHFHLGVTLTHLGKWGEAIEILNEAVRVNPQDPYAHYHLGLAYNQVGRFSDAIGAFHVTIDINPEDAFAHYNLGLAYEKTDHLASAVSCYKKAVETNPADTYARYHLALCYQRLGQYSLAMAELEEVRRINPQDAYAAYNLGSVYAYLGLADQAIEAYSNASELNPSDLYAHFNMGAILARDGMVDQAIEQFKKALELTPKNDAELALYSTLASQMTVNIEIATLNAKLKEVYFETVNAIIGCLDARDEYTAGHTNRVAVIATEIGSAMNLPREEMEALRIAAVLHDIGKVGVPDSILLKQGKLTPEEFLIMKEHPVKGAKILENVSFPWTQVVDYVKHHHERFDGTGYPDRLAGEAIPVGARILSLADFFDALATERPYKKAYPIPVVIEQAELQVKKAFDPRVVEALKQVTGRLEVLYKPAEALEELPTWESTLVDSA